MSSAAFTKFRDEDIRNLVRHPDADTRAVAARRICQTVRSAALSPEEREFARRLLASMAEDAAAMVRRALAVTLKNSPELPRDIALKLARDIDNIAVPVLANSPLFTDDDLIEILRSKATAKILAVAQRPAVSGDLVRAIIRYGDSHAVAKLAANDGAQIDPDVADNILEIYRDDDLITNAFISRRHLPIGILEKLITAISAEAAVILTKRHHVPVYLAADIAGRARERATLALDTFEKSDADTGRLIARIHEMGRLTQSFILRAAGLGRIDLLKHSLAVLAQISPEKAQLMLHDGGTIGLQTLCRQAGFDPHQSQFIRSACFIYKDLEMSGLQYDHAKFQSLMIERVLTLPVDMSETQSQWFLERLDGLETGFDRHIG